MYVTRGGEGVKKFEIFMDVIDGSPLNCDHTFQKPIDPRTLNKLYTRTTWNKYYCHYQWSSTRLSASTTGTGWKSIKEGEASTC